MQFLRNRCQLWGPTLGLLLFALLSVSRADSQSLGVEPPPTFFANLRGTVTDQVTGLPLPGARVLVPDLSLSTLTDSAGRFAWDALPLVYPIFTTTITITASGYGAWTIQNVRLLAADTLSLTAALAGSPTLIVQPPPISEDASARTGGYSTGESHPCLARHGRRQTCPDTSLAADQSNVPPPLTIRVRVTGWPYCDTSLPYTVQTLDFRDYVKHVLPNEWGASWPAESLKAGALAARMYAWYQVARGGKWPDADVYDSTCDQVYRSNISYASTDAAVDAIWSWRLMKDNLLVAAYYRAYYTQCQDAGLDGRCMGQWDSKWMADGGATWDQILYNFYPGSTLSLAPPNVAVAPPPVWLRQKLFLALVSR